MNHKEVSKYWDGNADAWTKLSRMGCDIYRDYLIIPGFFEMLPEVDGLTGLDIGCGEGHNTRLAAKRGAKMSAIDISSKFIQYAQEAEQTEPLGIEYKTASAIELPFGNDTFDFAMATMSFMDTSEIEKVIGEAYRVIKTGGFLQFSIMHPCFHTPICEWIKDETGRPVALKCGNYFKELNGEIEEWIFNSAPEKLKNEFPDFKIPRFTRPLSQWLNYLIEAGFILEEFAEPQPDDEIVAKYPSLRYTQIIAWILIIRCRKPEQRIIQ